MIDEVMLIGPMGDANGAVMTADGKALTIGRNGGSIGKVADSLFDQAKSNSPIARFTAIKVSCMTSAASSDWNP